MLEMQIKVYEDTQQLSELTGDDRASQMIVQAGKLSADEGRILQEADKALLPPARGRSVGGFSRGGGTDARGHGTGGGVGSIRRKSTY